MKKKLLSSFLLLAMVFSCFATAGATDIQPRATELDVEVSVSTSSYTSDKFSCVNGNGDTLRYWFDNTGSSSCTVTLYKTGFFGDSSEGSITVAAGKNGSGTFSNPGSGTFYIKVTSTSGIGAGVYGTLRANQLDL